MAIKHTKTSTIPDGPDATQVQPSDWNADHSLPVSASRLLGNATGVSAEVAELSLGSGLVFGAGSLELQIKTVNGDSLLGAGDVVIEAGGGLTLFEESRNTASPNATVPVHALTALGAESNIDFVIAPKGTGAILAQVPDGTAAGGNKRGTLAVDLQMSRSFNGHVASGDQSALVGGGQNRATAFRSAVVGGASNKASATNSWVIGGSSNDATGSGSGSIGISTTTRGVDTALSFGNSSGVGVYQCEIFTLRDDTSSDTPTQLTVTGLSPSTSTSVTLPSNSAYYLDVKVIGRNVSTNEAKSWSGTALIKRGANAASTTLIGSSIVSDFGDAAMSACTVTLSADTTRGALAVIATGLAATSIRWSAKVESVEVA